MPEMRIADCGMEIVKNIIPQSEIENLDGRCLWSILLFLPDAGQGLIEYETD